MCVYRPHSRGAVHMADYRLYCLDGAGKIGSGEWIEADNDEEAIAFCRAKKLHVKCELWDGPAVPNPPPDDPSVAASVPGGVGVLRLERFQPPYEIIVRRVAGFQVQVRFLDHAGADQLFLRQRVSFDQPAGDLFPIPQRVI